MFFFFPFAGVQAAAGSGASRLAILPMLPAPGSASADAGLPGPGFDLWGVPAEVLRKSAGALMSSLTALGNSANAIFSQVAAALALDRVAGDTTAFLEAFFGFGSSRFNPGAFASVWGGQPAGCASPMQSFMNPWEAFAQSVDFWTKLWTPAAPQGAPYSTGRKSPPSQPPAFTTKASTPGAFSWAFSLSD